MRDMNFYASLQKTQRRERQIRDITVGIFLAAILLIGAAYAGSLWMQNSIRDKITERQAYLNSGALADQSRDILEKKQMLDIMNQYYTAVEGMESGITGTYNLQTAFVEQMDSLMPPGVDFTQAEYGSTSFNASYQAANKPLIADLYRNMNNLGIFEGVYIPSINRSMEASLDPMADPLTDAGTEIFSFGIQCAMNGGVVR